MSDGFQRWKDGIDRANGDWDAYDATIKEVVATYNAHLLGNAWYPQLNWRVIKAMLWAETGPHDKDWQRRPMRIGVPNDPGLTVLLTRSEGSALVVPPTIFITSDARTQPRQNIRAGVGYLLTRMANYDLATVMDRDNRIFDVTVQPGDRGWESVARRCRSTSEVLLRLNPGHRYIHGGQVLKCQKASIQQVITGWKAFDYRTIARRYNGNGEPKGDAKYAEKFDYAMRKIGK
ncbi:peptidoglycan-binding protein [Variovorax sp. J2P1-59]|uniref:peptidoglycan-binding protein n=1 Tax=Variovorax flavidus TaxID=3053501 RepID=UPI002575EF8C|nr:peptidoglycan-binding protein [Variovorax sp. J2P1-59]MDM0076376.1 peptidoglycan-binding protein [Variovorax sp. J2P1-59]